MLSRRTNLRTISSTMIEKAVPEPVRVGARAVRTVVSPILLLIAIYAAWLFTPVYFRKIGFEEAVRNIARAAAYNDHDESEIHEEIMRKARELRIPVKDENVLVSREKDAVRINTTYYEAVNLPGRRVVTLNFAPASFEKTLSHAAIQVKSLKEGK